MAMRRQRPGRRFLHRCMVLTMPVVASITIRCLRVLIRWEFVNQDVVLRLHRSGQSYVHAFFHDQLLMMTYSYQGKRFGRRMAVLSSRHRDGEYVARTLSRFGHLMVRGSSDRGAVGGLKEMVRNLRLGRDAAFATDGPRGPRHQVQVGVVAAARLGAAPIVPVALAVSKKKSFVPGMPSSCRFPAPVGSSCTAIR